MHILAFQAIRQLVHLCCAYQRGPRVKQSLHCNAMGSSVCGQVLRADLEQMIRPHQDLNLSTGTNGANNSPQECVKCLTCTAGAVEDAAGCVCLQEGCPKPVMYPFTCIEKTDGRQLGTLVGLLGRAQQE